MANEELRKEVLKAWSCAASAFDGWHKATIEKLENAEYPGDIMEIINSEIWRFIDLDEMIGLMEQRNYDDWTKEIHPHEWFKEEVDKRVNDELSYLQDPNYRVYFPNLKKEVAKRIRESYDAYVQNDKSGFADDLRVDAFEFFICIDCESLIDIMVEHYKDAKNKSEEELEQEKATKNEKRIPERKAEAYEEEKEKEKAEAKRIEKLEKASLERRMKEAKEEEERKEQLKAAQKKAIEWNKTHGPMEKMNVPTGPETGHSDGSYYEAMCEYWKECAYDKAHPDRYEL